MKEIVAPPSEVTINNPDPDRLSLSWEYGSSNIDGFRIRREGEDLSGTLNANDHSYRPAKEDLGIPGEYYTYSVEVVGAGSNNLSSRPINILGKIEADGKISGKVSSGNTEAGVRDVHICAYPQKNEAISFDGVDDYIFTDKPGGALNGKTNFSIDFWLKVGDLVSGSQLILAIDDNEGQRKFSLTTSELQFLLQDSLLTSQNEWHHVILTFQDSLKLYMDGELILKVEDSNNFLHEATDNWYLGGGALIDDEKYFQGQLDEFRVWDKVLTEVERNEIAHQISSDTSLVVWYPFKVNTLGTEVIIADYARNNHATPIGTSVIDGNIPMGYCSKTDETGEYEIFNIAYGEETDFDIVPTFEDHGFDPDSLTKSLGYNQSTARSNVNFKDTTSFAIEGHVILSGTDCGLDSVKLELSHSEIGTFSVYTDASGFFAVSAPIQGTYTLTPSSGDHVFSPANMTLEVSQHIADLEFIDNTTHQLSGFVGGNCGILIADSVELLISSSNNACWNTTVVTDEDGSFSVELPAQEYQIEIV